MRDPFFNVRAQRRRDLNVPPRNRRLHRAVQSFYECVQELFWRWSPFRDGQMQGRRA
jgi:hypothetical protein